MSETAIEISKVSKIYSQGEMSVTAVNDVSFSIEKGGFVAICGPSGSGKTTLLNLIGCLDLPSSGEITVGSEVVNTMTEKERANLRLNQIGFIFQSYNLIPVLSALENVAFVLQLRGVDKKEREVKARQMLKEVGLEGMEYRRPGQLSGGQQQRVAIARAIVCEPSYILADEPTANVDSTTSEALLELMKSMNKRYGATFIFSTHDSLVMEHADRLIHLKDGSLS